MFNENLGHCLGLLSNDDKTYYFAGDFNIDLLKLGERGIVDDFINTFSSYGLYPTISKATRVTQYSTSLIDNIFTNDICHSIKSGILISDISDHFPIFVNSSNNYTISRNVIIIHIIHVLIILLYYNTNCRPLTGIVFPLLRMFNYHITILST